MRVELRVKLASKSIELHLIARRALDLGLHHVPDLLEDLGLVVEARRRRREPTAGLKAILNYEYSAQWLEATVQNTRNSVLLLALP